MERSTPQKDYSWRFSSGQTSDNNSYANGFAQDRVLIAINLIGDVSLVHYHIHFLPDLTFLVGNRDLYIYGTLIGLLKETFLHYKNPLTLESPP